MTSITLPDELVLTVFMDLEYLDLKCCQRVSKQFKRVTEDAHLDHKMFRGDGRATYDSGTQLTLHPIFPQLAYRLGDPLEAVFLVEHGEITTKLLTSLAAAGENATSPPLLIANVRIYSDDAFGIYQPLGSRRPGRCMRRWRTPSYHPPHSSSPVVIDNSYPAVTVETIMATLTKMGQGSPTWRCWVQGHRGHMREASTCGDHHNQYYQGVDHVLFGDELDVVPGYTFCMNRFKAVHTLGSLAAKVMIENKWEREERAGEERRRMVLEGWARIDRAQREMAGMAETPDVPVGFYAHSR